MKMGQWDGIYYGSGFADDIFFKLGCWDIRAHALIMWAEWVTK